MAAKQLVVGLTGRNGAGKGAVAEVLKDKGFLYYSLSDAIRAHLKANGIPESRENLIAGGNELRRAEGAGTLGERILTMIKSRAESLFVVDSIRTPAEVQALQAHGNFHLVQVVADEEVRFQRLMARKREGDSSTFEEFLSHEKAELESDNPSAQQLLATAAMATHSLENNGDLLTLQAGVATLVAELAASHG